MVVNLPCNNRIPHYAKFSGYHPTPEIFQTSELWVLFALLVHRTFTPTGEIYVLNFALHNRMKIRTKSKLALGLE